MNYDFSIPCEYPVESYLDYSKEIPGLLEQNDALFHDINQHALEAYGSPQSLRAAFIDAGFEIKVTPMMINQLVRICNLFEIRGKHAEALNSALVGVTPCHFLQTDADSIFEVFGINRVEFDAVIKKYPGIPKEFKVASDAFNIFIIWMVHLVFKAPLTETMKTLARVTLFKMMHYKFYTSVVTHNFPHGANADVMQYVVDNLNAKFDIKNPATPTWKAVIEKKSEELTSKFSIHYRTLETFTPDNRVTYVITDTQTRIRSTLINTVIQPYYKAKELNNKIGSYTNMQEIDGERFLRDITSIYDSMIVGICNQVVNINKFIDNEYVRVVVAVSTNISDSMLRQLLIAFSNTATMQLAKQQADDITHDGKSKIIVGYRELVTNIIQKSYRDCINNKVNVSSPLYVFEHVKNIYRSSRIIDEDILLVKRSVDYFVTNSKISSRESTQASLKIAFIIYILMLSFSYLK